MTTELRFGRMKKWHGSFIHTSAWSKHRLCEVRIKTARKWLEIACSGMDRAETNSLYIVYAGYLCRSDILTVLHRDRLWQGTDNSARSACVLSCGLCTRAFFRSWSRSKMFQLLQSGKLRMNVRAASRSCAAEMVDGIRKQWQKDGTKCMCPCNDHND